MIVSARPMEKYNIQLKITPYAPTKTRPEPALMILVRTMDNNKEIKSNYAMLYEPHIAEFFYALGFELYRFTALHYPENERLDFLQRLVWKFKEGIEIAQEIEKRSGNNGKQ